MSCVTWSAWMGTFYLPITNNSPSRGSCIKMYHGYLNSNKYINILNKHLLPRAGQFNGWTYVQDNASYHIINDVRNWFHNHQVKQKVKAAGPTDQPSLEAAVNSAISDVTSWLCKAWIAQITKKMKETARQ